MASACYSKITFIFLKWTYCLIMRHKVIESAQYYCSPSSRLLRRGSMFSQCGKEMDRKSEASPVSYQFPCPCTHPTLLPCTKTIRQIGTVRDCFGESLKENKAKKAKVEENCGTRPSKRRSGLKVKTNRPATPGERLGHQGVRVSEKYCKYTQTQKETILRIHQAHDLRVPAPSSTTYEPTPCLTLVDLVGFGVVYATHRANMVETLH